MNHWFSLMFNKASHQKLTNLCSINGLEAHSVSRASWWKTKAPSVLTYPIRLLFRNINLDYVPR